MDIEEGEAVEALDDINHDSIAQRLVEVLGDAQREFEGGVCTEKLGSKYGGYGSFLPTELRNPSVLAQTKYATAIPTLPNAKEKISPVHVGERTKRLEVVVSETDAGRGGVSSVDKALVGQKYSTSKHAVDLSLGRNERNKEIHSCEQLNLVKEAGFDRNLDTNNTNDCPSTSDRDLVAVDLPLENRRSRGISGVGDTSCKIQNYVDSRESDKMEQKKATPTVFCQKDPEDSRWKNKSLYDGLGLNDSSSLSLNPKEDDDTCLSDAYSSPILSPLTMIQAAMSQLQSKYALIHSPLHDVFCPPTDAKNMLLKLAKGSSSVSASAVLSSVGLDNGLQKSIAVGGDKPCQFRDQKKKPPEVKSTSTDGVPKTRQQMEKTKVIQEITSDARKSLLEISKECEQVVHEAAQDMRKTQSNPGLTCGSAENIIHNLNPFKQETAKELHAFEEAVRISRKEKGKHKSKDRASMCDSIKGKGGGLSLSRTYRMEMETSLSVRETFAQATVEQKEVRDAPRDANIIVKEGVDGQFHDHGVGKVDFAVGNEPGRDSNKKTLKGEKERGHLQRKDESVSLPGSSKDTISYPKNDRGKKDPFSKLPSGELSKDSIQVKEPSKDSLSVTYTERAGKEDHFNKVAKQSSFVSHKNAKVAVNGATKGLEHMNTCSGYLETDGRSFDRISKNIKLARRDNGDDKKLLKESGTKDSDAILPKTNNVENNVSHSKELVCCADIPEPVPVSAAAPMATLVLDNWVMCDKCGQWRLLLPEMDIDKLPKKFFCKMMAWLPGMNNCKYTEDETSNAVYAYLGIPNPKDAHVNPLATQPQLLLVPPVSLVPVPSTDLISSIIVEKNQGPKQNTTSYKKGAAGKVTLPVLSKCSSVSKQGDSDLKSKSLNDVDNGSQNREQACQELRVPGDGEASMPSLKIRKRPANTTSAEDFKILPSLKKMKVAEAGNPHIPEAYAGLSTTRDKMASSHDNSITHYHGKPDLQRDHLKDGRYDDSAASSKRLPSRPSDEQSNQGSPRDTAGVKDRQGSNKSEETNAKRKLKVRLKADEKTQKEGKRPLEEDASISQFGTNMKNADTYRIKVRKPKAELGTRLVGSWRKESFPTDTLENLKQPDGTDHDGPGSSGQGTFTRTIYSDNMAGARKRRKQKSVPIPPSACSLPVSSPESSTRKSKGLTSPFESTVSSPDKVHKASKPAGRSIARKDSDPISSSSAPRYSVVHLSGPGKRKLQSGESELLSTDEIVHSNAFLDASSNSDHNDYQQEESEEQHRITLHTRTSDTTRYANGRCSINEPAENFGERHGRNGQSEKNDEHIMEKDSKLSKNFQNKTCEKWNSDTECNGCKEKFTPLQRITDARGGLVSSHETHCDTLHEFQLHGKRAGARAERVDKSASSEGKETRNGITCDTKYSKVREIVGAGNYSSLQIQEQDGLHTANKRSFSESYEKVDNMDRKEGKLGPVRSMTGTKKGEAMVTSHGQHLLSKSDAWTRMDQDNGMIRVKAKSKNHNDLVISNLCGESLDQGKEVRKGPEEGPESRSNLSKLSPANGNMIKGGVGIANNIKGQPTHQASNLIKEAKTLKHTADRLEGCEAIRGDIYLHAALKFLQGAAILETLQDGGSKQEALSLYSGTAKLFEFCTSIYAKDMKATGLALKCAAVARMRASQMRSSSTSRTLAEIQSTMQLAPPFQLEESPSSSSSDVDNLNNQALPHEKLPPHGTAKELASPLQTSTSNVPASAHHHPQMTRLFGDAGEMCAAFDSWRRADHAISAAKLSCSDPLTGDAIRRVGDLNFSDVETLVRLVNSALEAIRP